MRVGDALLEIARSLKSISNMTTHASKCEHYWDESKPNISLGTFVYTQECIHCKKVRRV